MDYDNNRSEINVLHTIICFCDKFKCTKCKSIIFYKESSNSKEDIIYYSFNLGSYVFESNIDLHEYGVSLSQGVFIFNNQQIVFSSKEFVLPNVLTEDDVKNFLIMS